MFVCWSKNLYLKLEEQDHQKDISLSCTVWKLWIRLINENYKVITAVATISGKINKARLKKWNDNISKWDIVSYPWQTRSDRLINKKIPH